jgi:hypothetical protein
MTHFETEVIREVITALLDARDFLGYQLAHANNCMTDKQLDEIAEQYLKRKTYTIEDLRERIRVLKSLIGDRVDADVISTVFRCDYEKVYKAINEKK